jgi:hypothetical protein
MPSVLWSRRGFIKTIPYVILLVAAAFACVSSAQASSELARAPVVVPRMGSEPAWSRLANAAQEGAQEATQERAPSSVNPRKAVLLSLLLPGAGELYSGHKGRATGFFVTEGAIWANFAAWEIAGHLRKNNYIEQARLNAGIGTESESDDYWRLVGTYLRSSGSGPDSYEDALRRDARNEFPSDPAAQDAWVAARLPTGDRAWNWTSASLQESYIETRQNSTRAFSRAKFSFALAILNRVVSAIDTQVLHRRDMKAEQSAIEQDGTRLLTMITADGGGKVLIRHRF